MTEKLKISAHSKWAIYTV